MHDKFTTWTDSLGNEHAKLKEQSNYMTQLLPLLQGKVDSQAHLLGVKPTTITKYVQVATKTQSSFKATIDTSGNFSYVDNHVDVIGSVTQSTPTSPRLLVEKYSYTDTATITSYTLPKKFLFIKSKLFGTQDFLDVSFNDSNTHITGLQDIPLKQYVKPKNWGVGFQGGYSYINGEFRPYIGIGLSYNIIKF